VKGVTIITFWNVEIPYIPEAINKGDCMKNVWTVAALIAVATIPLLLLGKPEKKPMIPIAADANDIFEWERPAA
jgi:hypothetical protein